MGMASPKPFNKTTEAGIDKQPAQSLNNFPHLFSIVSLVTALIALRYESRWL